MAKLSVDSSDGQATKHMATATRKESPTLTTQVTKSQKVQLAEALDITAAKNLSFIVDLKEQVNGARILCKMPDEERDERPEKHNHEEWQTGYPGDLSNLQHEDAQNWKVITLVV